MLESIYDDTNDLQFDIHTRAFGGIGREEGCGEKLRKSHEGTLAGMERSQWEIQEGLNPVYREGSANMAIGLSKTWKYCESARLT